MITLITGLPRNGKSLYMMQMVLSWSAKEARPVYYDNIEGMKQSWQKVNFEDWQTLPPRAILVVDEAQFKIPTRGRGEPVEWIQKLATHGHNGLDIVLITQDPMLIDAFVRRLCQRHLHVMRNFGMQRATIHEYTNGVKEQVAKSRGESIRHEWTYPTALFGMYHSADAHTVKRSIPMRVYVLCALPVLLGVLGYFFYARWSARVTGEDKSFATSTMQASPPGAAASAPSRSGGSAGQPVTVAEYLAAQSPRVQGLAYTAPVFDEITKPTVAPYPAAIVSNSKECRAYSQQGTRLDMADSLCRSIGERGFFVAWDTTAGDRAPRSQDKRAESVARPLDLGTISGSTPVQAKFAAPARGAKASSY